MWDCIYMRSRAIDLDDKGWVEKQQALEAISQSGDATYDVARETLKQVNVDVLVVLS